jgi:M6 family metalloprotease-like protein
MKTTNLLSVFYLIFFIFTLACAGVGSVTSIPAAVPTSTQIALPVPTSTSTMPPPASVEECKLQPFAFTNVGLGIPNPTYKLPSLGDVKTIVLFADFADVPAVQTPQDQFSWISPNAEKFFHDVSYGRMKWTLEPHFVWLRLSQPSAYYGPSIHSYEEHLAFIQEAVDLADPDVDFSTADSVIVIVPPEATEITYGPAFGAIANEGYQADGKIFENGVTSGADLNFWGFLWLNHETGHNLGLPDLYAYQADAENYDDIHRFVGGFGLMGLISGSAPEFFAFERWQLGWLDDEQIICQSFGDQTTTLSAIEKSDGTKAVIVPLNDSMAIVVESRRPIGYDQALVKSGALVYTVNTSIYTGEGPVVVYPILENDPYREQSPLAKGESIVLENVTITVLDATDEGDIVQVTITER